MGKGGQARRIEEPPELLDLLESMTDGLIACDGDWRITRANRVAARDSRTAGEPLAGRDYREAFPTTPGSDLERDLRRAMADRVPIRGETFDQPTGRWFEVAVAPLQDGGLVSCRRDVSERKRAEQAHRQIEQQRDEMLGRWQLLFDRMPIACIVGDTQFRVVEWNPAAEKIFGYTREEILGADGFELLVAPASRLVAQEVRGRLADGDTAAHAVAENVAKDGRIVVCEWHNTPLHGADGAVVGFISMALDITAQKQAEEQLKLSESRLAEAQRVARVGSYSWDLVTGAILCSDETYRLLGTRVEGALSRERARSLVHPDDLPEVERKIEQALRDHQPFEHDWRAVGEDGVIRFAHSRSHVELDDAGVPIRIYGCVQDVTEQRQAERALAESELKLRTLADASPAIIWSIDENGGVRHVNRAYLEFFGVTEQELLEGGWKPLLHPDDAPAYIAEYAAAVREHRPFLYRTRVRRYDHRWRWMESRALPHRGEDGRYLGHVGQGLDITDQIETTAFLLESEKNLAAELAGMARLQEVSTRLVQAGDSTSLLEHIVDAAIAITAADMGNVQLFHPESATLKIVASRGLDQPFLDAFSSVREGQCSCGAAMQTGERVVIEDVTATSLLAGPDLTRLLASGVRAMQSTPLVTRAGQLVGMLSTHYRSARRPASRDLRVLDMLARQAADWIERRIAQAERERLLESERQARAESDRAARMKDEFLATLSHELRTPLSAILGWADVLRENLHDTERVRRGVNVIRRNAFAQAQLIGDLLDLSRVVTGKLRLDVERVALATIIDSAIEAVRPAADARRIGILSVMEPIQEQVHGDSARLRQILWNLLSNAVKFTPDGGRVEVVLARAGASVEITVSDNGKGIRPDFLPHVFERFRQADSSAAREQGGLGIGLALVKEIAELHGGQVRASSPGEGMGSTFVLQLPVAIARTAEEEREHAHVPPSMSIIDQEAPPLDGVRVLVLDDEPDALEVIQHILEDRRVEVATFGSVDSALDALETERFDVLVSDIGMPRRDGYDFIAEVRRRGIKTPAAALTAFARSEDRTRVLLSGYQAHLAKPLESRELVATVASLSGRVGS